MTTLPTLNPHALAWEIQRIITAETGKTTFTGVELVEALPHIEDVLRAFGVAPVVECLTELAPGGPFCQRPEGHDGPCGGAA